MNTMNSQTGPLIVNITYQLKGSKAEAFLNYLSDEHLENIAEAARKALFERLEQLGYIRPDRPRKRNLLIQESRAAQKRA